MTVLDSSAVLAFLFAEEGGEVARKAFETALISAVNVTEIVAKQIDRGTGTDLAVLRVEDLNLQVRPFDNELALLAGKLRSATRSRGLSLGDRACLALAIRENAVALTADRKWADLDVGCKIELIR
ncbi:PIN domain nuclease of toxin-antitoxin system [Mesorhizobium sp. J18]|uniref:type II toxin-antitoxin system VapC family toxin n=1 Tax=Mesorhizobium sp. J18 TaxID=935263 RepID=UPI00119AD680|nr:type II toxin-antitoxin system VapC family toxin [Mesorhizobium sp. J18]TWG99356.1 PIN domain nuclease of toxin-antitoxin system [Mesorhizobium sp. J18]